MELRRIEWPVALHGEIHLPASKSIWNRYLILQALSKNAFEIKGNLPADDVLLLQKALQNTGEPIYVGNAGTTFRFLLAYLNCVSGRHNIYGAKRLHERPHDALLEALTHLGSEIDEPANENEPWSLPGKELKGGNIRVHGTDSSQPISALMLIGWYLRRGLKIRFDPDTGSKSYINMTAKVLAAFDIACKVGPERIIVPHCEPRWRDVQVQSDWSAAGYLLAQCALLTDSNVTFHHLQIDGWQGDEVVVELLKDRLKIEESQGQIVAYSHPASHSTSKLVEVDLSTAPDLIPTMVCYYLAIEMPFHITGTHSLRKKESERDALLVRNAQKLGYTVTIGENHMAFHGKAISGLEQERVIWETDQDHRMVMAAGLLMQKHPNLWVGDLDSVEKSYPSYWNDVESLEGVVQTMDNEK